MENSDSEIISQGIYTCNIQADQYGIRNIGEARSVSWLEFQWIRFKEMWSHDPDVQMMKGLAEIAMFLLPELWALKAASTVRTVTATSKLTDAEYVARLTRYLNRSSRRVKATVQYGDDAIKHLDGAAGHVTMFNPYDMLKKPIVNVRYAGNPPGRLTIHHELLHYLDFTKNYGGKVGEFFKAGTARTELHVHYKLLQSKRWSSYSGAEQDAQMIYGKFMKGQMKRQLSLERKAAHFRVD